MLKAIILAAGEGTRMKSEKTKVLHKICGYSLIQHVLDAVKNGGFDEIIAVLGRNREAVEKELGSCPCTIVSQELGENKPYGTGYAVQLCQEYVQPEDHVVVVFGDTPLLNGDLLAEMMEEHLQEEADITVLSAVLEDPRAYGRIVRENGEFIAIVEQKDLDPTRSYSNEVNSGIFLFKGTALHSTINKLTTKNTKGEYLLTDTISLAREQGLKVICHTTEDQDIILGVNDREDLYLCEQVMKKREISRRRKDGVTITHPDLVQIDKCAVIENDVELRGYVEISGPCRIGKGTILENSTVKDSIIGKNCQITHSFLESSELGNEIKFGPYSHTRPGTKILDRVKIGNFVEVKNATMGEGSKAGHLAYIGDGDVGKGVNIGCGVIFVNYDGKNKHRTIVEDYGFVGSNVNLVAPVTVHKNAFIAAGSTVSEDVEEDALAIERAPLIKKKDWVIKKGLHKGDEHEEL
ncbi:MAG: bifunctional UDP-N-acetylglucosamine diphosphorylase/glucosamine-1-phosphate N-acetyltransferase GlmU [Tissierellia bacterium]|nr:bifunctional UDP-N-acetylglucosamine diphosphorylase/glucosamine-1-phosphate N-acetyltransferase GlmU [Tissierellia bacterium]